MAQLTLIPQQEDSYSPVPYSIVQNNSLSYQIKMTTALLHTALCVWHISLSQLIRTAAVLFYTALQVAQLTVTRDQDYDSPVPVAQSYSFHTRSSSYLLLSPMRQQCTVPLSQRTSTQPCGSLPLVIIIRDGMALTVPGPSPSCTQSQPFCQQCLLNKWCALSPLFTIFCHCQCCSLFSCHWQYCSLFACFSLNCSLVSCYNGNCSFLIVFMIKKKKFTNYLSLTTLLIFHCH